MEYMGFVCFAPGCIVGPFLEYKDYIDWIELRGDYEYMPRGLSFSTVVPTIIQTFRAILMSAVKWVVINYMGFAPEACGQPDWADKTSVLWRFFYYNIVLTGSRWAYYSVFTF